MKSPRKLILRLAIVGLAALTGLQVLPWPESALGLAAMSPFLALACILAHWTINGLALAGLPLLALALWRGRWFCFNLCPTGFILKNVGRLNPCRRKAFESYPRLGPWIVILALGGALAGIPLFLVLDPLTLLNGFFSVWRWETPSWTNRLLAAGFLLIVLISCLRPNIWCERLCPLGAIQGLLHHYMRRIGHRFKAQGGPNLPTNESVDFCSGESVTHRHGRPSGSPLQLEKSENFATANRPALHGSALSDADERSISELTLPAQHPGHSGWSHEHPAFGRRALLAMLGGAGLAWWFRARTSVDRPAVIRPPGAMPESSFVGLCARCGNCLCACPTGIIEPDLGASGVAGLLTPVLNLNRSYCDEWCRRCTQVCPTGAIRRLALEAKRNLAIGLARVNRAYCLAWTYRETCMVCQEFCPYQAIRAEFHGGVNCPVVKPVLCRGCGACQSQCPAQPLKAIRVAPV